MKWMQMCNGTWKLFVATGESFFTKHFWDLFGGLLASGNSFVTESFPSICQYFACTWSLSNLSKCYVNSSKKCQIINSNYAKLSNLNFKNTNIDSKRDLQLHDFYSNLISKCLNFHIQFDIQILEIVMQNW